MSNNPYDDFFKNKPDQPETPASDVAPSEQMQSADRGQPTLKVERDSKVSKNIFLAIGAIVFALLIVAVIIGTLIKRITPDEEQVEAPVENSALAKTQEESLANQRARIEADKKREEEYKRLERERLCR